MTCTKTGCHIFISPYGEYAYGDAFELEGVAYFRIVQRARSPIFPVLHYTIIDFDNWFDKDTSRPSTLITARYACLGYDGLPVGEYQEGNHEHST